MAVVSRCFECREPTEAGELLCARCFGWRAARVRLAQHRLCRAGFGDLPPNILAPLARAELEPADVTRLTDAELLSIRGLGPERLRVFRQHVPLRAPPIANWVGEGSG